MAKIHFTDEHEWIKVDGDVGTVGITDYAQGQLGDVVFVEMPDVGAQLARGDDAGVVESVKAASEVYAPVSGEVIEINEALADAPDKVNGSAQTDGWFFKIKLSDPDELEGMMDAAAYKDFVASLE
jgi:glycine cleavage system H protein